MNKIGFFITCYDEITAIKYSISSLRMFYKTNPIYLVHESNEDFNFLKKDMNTFFEKGEDTMSSVLKIKQDNFRSETDQKNIKRALITVLNRITSAIEYCQTEYMMMHCPDTLVRGELSIPDNCSLLGSTVNSPFPCEINDILLKNGGVKVSAWGGAPGIFNSQEFLNGKNILFEKNIIDELCNSFYAVFAHDIMLSIIFSLIGKTETFNSDIIECGRNPYWEQYKNPLVHQFRRYYPIRTAKYKVNE